MVTNTPEEAKYWAIKLILDDDGFIRPEIKDGKLIFKDQIQEILVKDKGLTEEHIRRYIKEREEEGIPIDTEEGFVTAYNKEEFRKCYDNIVTLLKYYSDLNPRYYNLAALWIIGTYLQPEFNTYPYLFLNAMRGSGKTRLLKLITALARDGQLMASMTEAVLFRTSGTLAIDEFENLGSKDKNELRELLNAAYKKGIKIVRMRKKKIIDGETQEAETFSVYRPILMANIWGMEEVLGDRCIHLQLEKSENQIITRLVENFEENMQIKQVSEYLKSIQCSLCSVVTKKNINTAWNEYVYNLSNITTLTTHNTYTPLSSLTTQEDLDLFKRIYDTNIDGRHLELFFPLFLIAGNLGDDVLTETLEFAKHMIHEKKIDEITESKDVLVFKLVSTQKEGEYISINELTTQLRYLINDGDMEWLNSKWMGRALKRLQLTIDKRRVGDGIQITLNVAKAKRKLEIFMGEQKE